MVQRRKKIPTTIDLAIRLHLQIFVELTRLRNLKEPGSYRRCPEVLKIPHSQKYSPGIPVKSKLFNQAPLLSIIPGTLWKTSKPSLFGTYSQHFLPR
jgi:hypothetical protein